MPEATLVAALLLVALSLLWFWWAWRSGGYFGVIFYPGAIGLALALAVLLLFAPWPGSLRSSWGVPVALGGLLLLGAWTLFSGLWSPAPDEALSDGSRVLLYAAAFMTGLWLCRMLGRNAPLSLLPLALAGGAAGLGTAITLATGDDITRYLSRDGTLEFPLGYHNANAAFFLIAAWPALALAASPQVDWRLRGPMLGCAVLCAEVGFLSQSRGSLVGIAAAVFVWLLVSPYRLRAIAWLVLAAAAAAAAVPWLSDVYTTFNDGDPVGPALDDAGRAMIFTAAGATLIGLAAARLVPAPRRPGAESRSLIVPFAAMIAVLVVGGLATFAVAAENPVDWVDERLSQLGSSGTPELSGEESRFGFNATSERADQWRVAWEDAREEPLLGQGAGAFQFTYARERDADLTARDAHSVEMELLGELGFPGLVMFVAVVVGARRGRVALANDRAGVGHALGGGPCRRGLLARSQLGRLVLDVPGGDRARVRPHGRGRGAGAHGCPPGAGRRGADRRRRCSGRRRRRDAAAVPQRALRQRRIPRLAVRPSGRVRRPRPGPGARSVLRRAVPRRGCDRPRGGRSQPRGAGVARGDRPHAGGVGEPSLPRRGACAGGSRGSASASSRPPSSSTREAPRSGRRSTGCASRAVRNSPGWPRRDQRPPAGRDAQTPSSEISPFLIASAIACARVDALSFVIALRTCVRTVSGER